MGLCALRGFDSLVAAAAVVVFRIERRGEQEWEQQDAAAESTPPTPFDTEIIDRFPSSGLGAAGATSAAGAAGRYLGRCNQLDKGCR